MCARHSFQRLLFHILLKKEKASHRSLARSKSKGALLRPHFLPTKTENHAALRESI
jgi:hypothetical protein